MVFYVVYLIGYGQHGLLSWAIAAADKKLSCCCDSRSYSVWSTV